MTCLVDGRVRFVSTLPPIDDCAWAVMVKMSNDARHAKQILVGAPALAAPLQENFNLLTVSKTACAAEKFQLGESRKYFRPVMYACLRVNSPRTK